MQPETRKLLTDMLDAGMSISRFLQGKALGDLGSDDLLRSGIYYKFVIVGEALVQLRQKDPRTADRVSENWRIVGFRNQIIHGYGQIDDEITWRIIEQKLPVLLREIEGLLNE